MKKVILILIFGLLAIIKMNAQNIGINTTGTVPDKSAMLDVSSTDKGILVPRMNAAQRLAIVAPAEGLLVYQVEAATGFYYFDGTTWSLLLPEAAGKNNFNFKGSIAQGFDAKIDTKVNFENENYLNNAQFINSTFIAPSSGIYSFTTNINMYGNAATESNLGFFVNDVERSNSTFNVVFAVFQNLSYTDNLQLATGDQVTVKINPSKYIAGFAVSFSGFKIN